MADEVRTHLLEGISCLIWALRELHRARVPTYLLMVLLLDQDIVYVLLLFIPFTESLNARPSRTCLGRMPLAVVVPPLLYLLAVIHLLRDPLLMTLLLRWLLGRLPHHMEVEDLRRKRIPEQHQGHALVCRCVGAGRRRNHLSKSYAGHRHSFDVSKKQRSTRSPSCKMLESV
jgi:hypothetical protein